MNLTPAKERLIRAALRDKILSVCGFAVFTDKPLINGKQDFIAQFYKPETQHAGGNLCKYALIEFRQFTDTNEGCADNPVVLIDYAIHAFVEFYGPSGAASDNSLNELTAFILDFRNAILLTPILTLSDASEQALNPLVQPNFIITDNDDLTGLAGHVVDLTLQVEIR